MSLGLGGDPLDERQLAYVDPCRDLQALPCMALVLGHPGFWLGNPATGVDALRLVHGEQRLEWRRPLPAEGEVIGRTRVTGLVDKGADRARCSAAKVLSDALSGEVLAVARSTTFLRGDGGFGGSRQVPETPHRLPERTPDLRLDLPTRPEQACTTASTATTTPPRGARGSRPASRGRSCMACAPSAWHSTRCCAGSPTTARQLGHLQVRFSAPVFPGETLRTEMWSDGSFRTRVVERDVVVLDNGRVGPPPERPD